MARARRNASAGVAAAVAAAGGPPVAGGAVPPAVVVPPVPPVVGVAVGPGAGQAAGVVPPVAGVALGPGIGAGAVPQGGGGGVVPPVVALPPVPAGGVGGIVPVPAVVAPPAPVNLAAAGGQVVAPAVGLAAGQVVPPDIVALFNIVGIRPTHHTVVYDAWGIDALEDLALFNTGSITTLVKHVSAFPGHQNAISIKAVSRLNSAVKWVQDRLAANIVPVLADLTVNVMTAISTRENLTKDKDSSLRLKTLPKFDGNNWRIWYTSFVNYCKHTEGCTGIPLYYVFHDENERPIPAVMATLEEKQQSIWSAALNGDSYNTDNSALYTLLSSHLLETTAYVWVQEFEVRS